MIYKLEQYVYAVFEHGLCCGDMLRGIYTSKQQLSNNFNGYQVEVITNTTYDDWKSTINIESGIHE